MGRFIEGCDRRQKLLLPDCVDDYVSEDNAVRVVDVFIDELDLAGLGFEDAASTGRPGYHPAMLLKLYLYGSIQRWTGSLRASFVYILNPLLGNAISDWVSVSKMMKF